MEPEDLIKDVGSIKGQISVLLKLMVILVAGMGYAILQNHQADVTLAVMEEKMVHTEGIFSEAKDKHDLRMSDLEDSLDSVSTYCCGEVEKYR